MGLNGGSAAVPVGEELSHALGEFLAGVNDCDSLSSLRLVRLPGGAIQENYAVDVEFKGGSEAEPWARVFMEIQGVEKSAESTGDGPVNAAIEAVKQLTGKTAVRLQDYELSAVSGGSDAQGKVSLSINEEGVVSRGQGRHTDVVVASAEAFVNALNQQAYQLQLNARRSDPPEADA